MKIALRKLLNYSELFEPMYFLVLLLFYTILQLQYRFLIHLFPSHSRNLEQTAPLPVLVLLLF